MITAAELLSIQAEAQRTMLDTCLVQRSTPTNDGFGSQTLVWNTVATTVGRIGVPTGGMMVSLAAKLGTIASWQVSLPDITDVRVNDQLVINGQTLRVQAVYNPQTLGSVCRVIASEIR